MAMSAGRSLHRPAVKVALLRLRRGQAERTSDFCFHGEDCGEGRLNDTWLWGGHNWIGVQTSRTAEPSSSTSFDYDRTVGGMMLFGGFVSSSTFTNSTWFLEAQKPE